MNISLACARPYFKWAVSATWQVRGDVATLPRPRRRRLPWDQLPRYLWEADDDELAAALGVPVGHIRAERERLSVPATEGERTRQALERERVRMQLRPQGHFITHLIRECGLSARRVRRALRALVVTGEARTFHRDPGGRLILNPHVEGDQRTICAFPVPKESRA